MKEVVEPVCPPVPETGDGRPQRVSEEVDVEKTVEETRADKQRHAQTPDVSLGGDSTRHCADGRHNVGHLYLHNLISITCTAVEYKIIIQCHVVECAEIIDDSSIWNNYHCVTFV